MKLGVEVENGQQSSNPELFFWSDHPIHPTHLPNPPQNINFDNFGPIWMKCGVEIENGQQTSSPELFLWSNHLYHPNHPTRLT